MQSLTEILNLRDPDNQEKFLSDIKAYIDYVKHAFRDPGNVDNDMLQEAIAALIPAGDMSNVFSQLEILKFSTSDEDPYYNEINLLFNAASLKENIVENASIDNIPLDINSRLSILKNDPEAKEELQKLQQVKDAIKILLSLDKKGRMERLTGTLAMIGSIISAASSQITASPTQNGFIKEDFDNLNDEYNEMLKADIMNDDLLDDAELRTVRLISSMNSALAVIIKSLAQMSPEEAMGPLAENFERLFGISDELFGNETDITHYHQHLDQYALVYTGLMNEIKDVANAPETREYIRLQSVAAETSKQKFSKDKYAYLLSAQDLHRSENLSLKEEKHMPLKVDNRFYISKLAPFLKSILEHTNSPMKADNMNVENDSDAHVNQVTINVTGDILPVWTFKTNFKITTAQTPQGFAVLHLGTDSALLCNALMGNDINNNIDKLITTVLLYEKSFRAKIDKFVTKETHKTTKKSFSENVLTTIDNFKYGNLPFNEFCKEIEEHATKAKSIGHDGIVGKIRSVTSNKLPGTVQAAIDFSRDLNKLRDSIESTVKNQLRADALDPVPQPPSPTTRLRR